MSNTRNQSSSIEEVYAAIDGERDYQDLRWDETNSSSGGKHSYEEWIVYIEAYLAEMKTALAHSGSAATQENIGGQFRKVAAMAVACMEQNGAVPRDPEEIAKLAKAARLNSLDDEIPL